MRYILADDVTNVVVSARRTGTTWLQALLGAYLVDAYGLPEDLAMRSQELTRAGSIPITAFTHDPQRHTPGEPVIEDEYRGKRVALLIRDPRDVIISVYMLERYRWEVMPPHVPPADFARERLPALVEFYETWLSCDQTALAGMVVIQYERLHAAAADELRRLVEFFGYKMDEPAIARAVQFASFENMQELEKSGKFHEHYKVNDMLPKDKPVAMRTRSARIGGYRKWIKDETLAWVNEQIDARPALRLLYGSKDGQHE